jgi:hypothetical protein
MPIYEEGQIRNNAWMNEEYPPGFVPPEEDTEADPAPPSTDLPKTTDNSSEKNAEPLNEPVHKLPKSSEKSAEPANRLLESNGAPQQNPEDCQKEPVPQSSPVLDKVSPIVPTVAKPIISPLVAADSTGIKSLRNLRQEYQELRQQLEDAEILELHQQIYKLKQVELEKTKIQAEIKRIEKNIVELKSSKAIN